MLGERESELGSQHIAALKEVQAQHQKGSSALYTSFHMSIVSLYPLTACFMVRYIYTLKKSSVLILYVSLLL